MTGFSLDHLRTIVISGPQAGEFLHAQLTADVTGSTGDSWLPAAWCDRKGRTLAFVLFRRTGEPESGPIELIAPAGEIGKLASGLQMYSIGRDVKVGEPGALTGFQPAPAAPGNLAPDRARSIEPGPARSDPVRCRRWQVADLVAGLPWLCGQASGRHLPQVLGLETLGGLSYRKGCYPGQEVIARAHYLGRTKRHLTGFRAAGGPAPQPGSPVTDGPDGSTLGETLESISLPGAIVGLAVVREHAGTKDAVHIQAAPAVLTEPRSLCYDAPDMPDQSLTGDS